MNRQCPKCAIETIPVSGLIVSNFDCGSCGEHIGVRWFYRAVFFVVIVLVTAPSAIAVLAQQGIYAALLWVPFPIGALGYIKARFCPLEVKRRRDDSRRPSGA